MTPGCSHRFDKGLSSCFSLMFRSENPVAVAHVDAVLRTVGAMHNAECTVRVLLHF